MKRAAVFLCLALGLVSSAHADTVPDYMLDKDFTACMGGEDPNKSTDRRDYCLCIRDSMKNWNLDQYGQLASQMAASSGEQNQPVPSQLEDLAKSCIAKVLN